MIEHNTLSVGPLGANCHILSNPETSEAIVVDPGDEAPEILALAKRLGLRIVAIWNTHGHIDHVNANAAVHAATKAPISIHEAEGDWLDSETKTLALWAGVEFHPSKPNHLWKDGDILQALGEEWVVHHTPGHSPGMSSIVCEAAGIMVAGDLLFSGSIGRMDLPGGSEEQMVLSLNRVFHVWGKDDWIVLPGHGPATTIGQERRRNFLLKEMGIVP
jgi:hydroxyacylglutathione hydrolase